MNHRGHRENRDPQRTKSALGGVLGCGVSSEARPDSRGRLSLHELSR
jgi:hypothetical protein